ncbi:hypothetical protein RJ641_024259 [Dillenia turbinata]|uniref:Uncharacterized protein n=1 Tax=Dillenia turbinata TaxID=194707 RepID=A0AAN8YT98_9MAGN
MGPCVREAFNLYDIMDMAELRLTCNGVKVGFKREKRRLPQWNKLLLVISTRWWSNAKLRRKYKRHHSLRFTNAGEYIIGVAWWQLSRRSSDVISIAFCACRVLLRIRLAQPEHKTMVTTL